MKYKMKGQKIDENVETKKKRNDMHVIQPISLTG